MRTRKELQEIAKEVVHLLNICMKEDGEEKALELGLLIHEEEFKQMEAKNEKTFAYAIKLADGRIVDTPYMAEIREEMKSYQKNEI
jgi:hypothetical protein